MTHFGNFRSEKGKNPLKSSVVSTGFSQKLKSRLLCVKHNDTNNNLFTLNWGKAKNLIACCCCHLSYFGQTSTEFVFPRNSLNILKSSNDVVFVVKWS